MAKFEIPKVKQIGEQLTVDGCYRAMAEMSYLSPIEVVTEPLNRAFETSIENDIYKAVLNYGISVDKEELIKALRYDRDQYTKGFVDGSKGSSADIRAEVAREIFEEIEKCTIRKVLREGEIIFDTSEQFAELKKKYTEDPSPINMCICCGEIIPEGRQVCPACEKQLKNYKPKGVKTKTVRKYVAPDLGVQLTIDDMENNND